jgi:hypothetical protein
LTVVPLVLVGAAFTARAAFGTGQAHLGAGVGPRLARGAP